MHILISALTLKWQVISSLFILKFYSILKYKLVSILVKLEK